MQTLYLTSTEESLFSALSDTLREGWTVEQETLSYTDTPLKRAMRLSLLRVHDPILTELHTQIPPHAEPREIAEMLHDTDLSEIDEDDLAALFFAVGPETLSEVIHDLLASASTDSEIEGVTALTVLRHMILQSYHPASPQ